jgi:hypothetical protein
MINFIDHNDQNIQFDPRAVLAQNPEQLIRLFVLLLGVGSTARSATCDFCPVHALSLGESAVQSE